MTGKILDEILEAEDRAAEIKRSASAKASDIVSKARLDGEMLCREVREHAASKKRELASEVSRVSDEALASARADAENKTLIVCAAASANIPDAVNFIIGKVGSIWQ